MKYIFFYFTFSIMVLSAFSQDSTFAKLNPTKKVLNVDAACGQCQFKMNGKGCTLAVKMNGKAYFVDKAGIDDFGDAHATMGFGNAMRKAQVQGKIIKNKFVPTYFKLVEKN
jgi:hypothetical protein